jgi:thiol:disulfide interchange protein
MTAWRRLTHLLLTLMLLPLAASAMFEDDELLDPDAAFALNAEVVDAGTLRLIWTIADGYYMYREQFRFTPESEGLELGEPRIPDGTVKEDEFFGRVETYRDRIEIELPILAAALIAVAVQAGETPAPQPVPQADESCSVCDLRQQSKRRLAEARQAAQAADKDTTIIALPPVPKDD